MKADAGWPRYMKRRKLKGGTSAYYWVPTERDRASGFTLRAEALGQAFAAACERANRLNVHLDAWRQGQHAEPNEGRVGTVDWWVDQYLRSKRYRRLKPRQQRDYKLHLGRIADLQTSLHVRGRPQRMGDLPCSSISEQAADRIYDLLRGPDEAITRQANYAVDVARLAWNVVAREHRGLMLIPMDTPRGRELHPGNPWAGIDKERGRDTAVPCTRQEAFALAEALNRIGHPAIGAAALIAFEWHQRPQNIIAGHIRWSQYRPSARPSHVEIYHHKTDQPVWLPLEQDRRRLFPELEARLAELPRLGPAVVMLNAQRAAKGSGAARQPRLYSYSYAQHMVQRARQAAGLPAHVTLEACRHGGLTELGDAEVNEQGVMALSGHKTPSAARLYLKRTDRQRLNAAARRRDFVEAQATEGGDPRPFPLGAQTIDDAGREPSRKSGNDR